MPRIVLYLLACLMAVTVVNCKNPHSPTRSKAVMSLHEACVKQGHSGECTSLNRPNGQIKCDVIMCASIFSYNGKNSAFNLRGFAPNGLKCGTKKVCENGSCKKLKPGETMPTQQIITSFPQFNQCEVYQPPENMGH